MKLVVQRVAHAHVNVNGKTVGKIEKGFVVLLGVANNDTTKTADYLVNKLCNLRVFTDEQDKMNLSLNHINGQLLIISQFTLYADCKKGNRPSFIAAADPNKANELYEYFKKQCKELGYFVESGIFGEHMEISLLNDGPVTILMEKEEN